MPKSTERDTREEIIQLAMELTQSRSFNWLSYQDISDRLSIRKASIHYHFPTKQDLGVALLKHYRELFAEWSREAKSKYKSAPERFDAYFDYFRGIMGKNERVCPGGVFSLEWQTLSDGMKTEVKGLFNDHRKFLDVVIREGREAKELREEGSVEEQIAMIGSCVQGALQIARVQGHAGGFNAALKQLRSMLIK